MGVNSLLKTVTRQRRGYDLNPGPSTPESSTLTTRLPSHDAILCVKYRIVRRLLDSIGNQAIHQSSKVAVSTVFTAADEVRRLH